MNNISPDIDPLYRETHDRVIAVNRRYRLIFVAAALTQFAFIAVVLFLTFLLMEALFDLSAPLRLLFWGLQAGMFMYYLFRNIFPNLRKAIAPSEIELSHFSRLAGKNNAGIQDALVNFLQIYRDEGIQTSPGIKNLSLKQLYLRFRGVDLSDVLSWERLRRPGLRLAGALAVFLAALLLFPAVTWLTAEKMLHPTRTYITPLPVSLHTLTGDMSVLKNDPVKLSGEYIGIRPSRLWLVFENLTDGADSVSTERLEIALRNNNRFEHEIKHTKNSFSYWFEAEVEMTAFNSRPALSLRHQVSVVERPFIRELQVRLNYPAYTRIAELQLPLNDGEVTALEGTIVKIAIEANKLLAEAWIQFLDSTRIPLTTAANHASGGFTVAKDGQYSIAIRDAAGVDNYQPVRYSVFALQDERPFVEITRPGQDLELGEELSVPLQMNLRDDFGFGRLTLKGHHIRAGSTGDTNTFAVKLPIQHIERARAVSDYGWDLQPYFLVPDDYIEYYAEVYDNNVISGPKSARSQTFIIRLPSLMEILQSADENLADRLEETKDIAEETRELREKLEEINREMKREEELTWERKQQIQEQTQKQQQSMEQLEKMREELQNVVNELDQRDVLSQETLEKYFELQKMMEELATPEMRETMKALQEALENADMDEVRKAMERFELSVEQFEERIERTFELFKRVQMEQKMDELNKMAQALMEKQDKINQQLAPQQQPDTKTREQLAQQEENLAKDSEFLKQELDQTRQEFAEMMAEIAKELEKAGEFMEEEQLSEQMQQMQQQIQQGESQKARQSGEDLKKQLEMLQSMMQQARQKMQQQQQQELMQSMQKVQQDLLRASFQQEQLIEKSQQSDMASSQLKQMAREQSQLRENAQSIIKQMLDISRKSFFMQPGMSQTMQSLMENMDNAISGLANRNPRGASRQQEKAMGNYNQAILSMQSSMNNMMQSGSGTGFEQFMQQMQQMAGQQGQLNQESMGLLQQPGQQPGGQMPGQQLSRMARQQQMIRNSLEKLNEQMGNRQDVLGRLGDLGEEMEKVIEALERQQLSPKVIERQQHILSRLLDAQKSVREKEHSKKRQAERERGTVAKSPPQLRQEMLERENQLRKEMLEALKEGYSAEYKEYIKLYYDYLSRQRSETQN